MEDANSADKPAPKIKSKALVKIIRAKDRLQSSLSGASTFPNPPASAPAQSSGGPKIPVEILAGRKPKNPKGRFVTSGRLDVSNKPLSFGKFGDVTKSGGKIIEKSFLKKIERRTFAEIRGAAEAPEAKKARSALSNVRSGSKSFSSQRDRDASFSQPFKNTPAGRVRGEGGWHTAFNKSAEDIHAASGRRDFGRDRQGHSPSRQRFSAESAPLHRFGQKSAAFGAVKKPSSSRFSVGSFGAEKKFSGKFSAKKMEGGKPAPGKFSGRPSKDGFHSGGRPFGKPGRGGFHPAGGGRGRR